MVSEWTEVFASAMITNCRRAGLQHNQYRDRQRAWFPQKAGFGRHARYSSPRRLCKVFLGTRSCLKASYRTPHIDSQSDPGGETYEKPSSCSEGLSLPRRPFSITFEPPCANVRAGTIRLRSRLQTRL